ncbi:hypothetical protein H7U32_06310 [Bifidobacterium pullorum subsp. saeculare]|uniref:Uncharacterized protein n=1 Tax=Bifidobacterium pullorum subsp. saeculare TaxID=78257 RepID=A0A938WX73_9BIFI|nr:hypothetical protein [Bifidobacterium pullorum]MBM6699924.1 hypothetical protein [Bifidobacterium pullorum subsp. saeculare]
MDADLRRYYRTSLDTTDYALLADLTAWLPPEAASRSALVERMPQLTQLEPEPESEPSNGVEAFDSPEQLLEKLNRGRVNIT